MKLGVRAISVRRADPQKAPRPTSVAATNDGSQQAMFTAVPPKVVSLANAVTNAGAPFRSTSYQPGVSRRPSVILPLRFLVAAAYIAGKTHPP